MKADWSALVDDLVDIDRPTNATCAPLHHTHTSLMNGNFLFVPPDKSMNWTSLASLSEKWLFFLFSFGLPSLSIHWVCVKIRFKFAGVDSDEHSDLTVQLLLIRLTLIRLTLNQLTLNQLILIRLNIEFFS